MSDTETRPSGPRDGSPDAAAAARTRMPLLTLITQQSLDEDYLLAAEKRAAGAPRPPRGRPQRTAAVVVAVFGLLVSTAFVQTSRNADVNDASRASLIRRVEGRRDRLANQQNRLANLRERNATLETNLSKLVDSYQSTLVTDRRLRATAGFAAVVGEGMRITVTDRPDADPNQQVHDADLQLLVNGLWEAGAEAVAVNNQRVSTRTAVRKSGAAIRVNDVGIASPYVVEAIGDRLTLSAKLFDTTTGLGFAGVAEVYGFTYDVQNVDQLRLPSAPPGGLSLRSASIKVGAGTGTDADIIEKDGTP